MVSPQAVRRKVLITGAAGGIGRACARTLGATHDLVLTDRAASSLDGFADELATEGYVVSGTPKGELLDEALLARLAGAVAGAPFALIHCAGLSPSLAGWRDIMAVNLVATEKLLRALEPDLRPGSVAVLISSAAGYRTSPSDEAKAAIADPLADGFLERIENLLQASQSDDPVRTAGNSYTLSKYAVHRICERRALPWGKLGARILSISPTLSLTPMGRSEIAGTPAAAAFLSGGPLGRPGTAMDIAQAAEFLVSEKASFISGCDIRVDGGSVAATVLAPSGS
ncbi:MAG TPA: SDR family oxidoreductase [Novosphingobium sp.]|nr:SDR family oxidoreductase [Novosphingobium sp.]